MDARTTSDLDSISYSTTSDSDHDLLLLNDSLDSEEERPSLEDSTDMKYTVKSKLTRQPSNIVMKNKEGVELTFTSETCIGRGSHAAMLRFSQINPPLHSQPITFAVRKPHGNLTYHKTYEEQIAFIERERRALEFRKAIYPHEAPYKFFSSTKIRSAADTDYPFHTTVRTVFPEIKNADTFEVFLQKNRDYDLLALVIYKILIELQRIHDVVNILHGDISARNILIDRTDFTIHFIDLTFGYSKDEDATIGYCNTLKELSDCYFAPERKTLTDDEKQRLNLDADSFLPCPAHPSQDVYSVAIMLEDAISKLHKQPEKSLFMNSYHCIIEFIALGKNNPTERPSLASIINALEPLLFMANLKYNLINLNTRALTPLLDKLLAEYSEPDIYRVLYTLCRNEEYLCIRSVVDYLCMKKAGDRMTSILSLFSHLARCEKRTTNIANNFFSANDRLSMIKEINLTFELADMITHNRDKTCSFASYEAIQKLPTLQSIFEDLVNDGHIQLPGALNKAVVLETHEEHKKIMP